LAILTDLFNKVYETGYIPADLAQSIFIITPKKPKALEYPDFRTISPMRFKIQLAGLPLKSQELNVLHPLFVAFTGCL